MSGLDKMIQQIEAEANAKAQQIMAEADQQAQKIRSERAEACEQELAKISEKSTRDIAAYRQRLGSTAEQKQKLAVLETKQQIISDAINEALKTVQEKPDAAYFDLIRIVVRRYARGQAGQIAFSKRDLDRMPPELMQELDAIAHERGGSLTLAKQPRPVDDGGFVLIYGGIEENCTFPALFEAHREQLQDKVHALLFA